VFIIISYALPDLKGRFADVTLSYRYFCVTTI